MGILKAGAATTDISPRDSQFLFGYPHVERYSTGIHDPLLSSALYLSDGQTDVMFIANDIIYVSKDAVERVRSHISKVIGIPSGHIMVTATHTHSGPVTVDWISCEHDPVVPKADPVYLGFLEDRIVAVAIEAWSGAQPARVGLTIADGTGVGTNRRDPAGPADPEVPVLIVRAADGDEVMACMLVYSMHPTVLHEDSKFVSSDFPGMVRRYLQQHVLGEDCVVLYHTGPAGNQSPRHVTRANTFAEAARLGEMLGRAVARVLPAIEYTPSISLAAAQSLVDLPGRAFPSVVAAEARLVQARERLKRLQHTNAPRQETRTAEVDWFGAEETLTLARAVQEGRLDAFYESCLPAEVQILRVGRWSFVGWPGEIFVEYALAVKEKEKDAFVISLANGELQGYIVTEDAALEGGYEASNALFGPDSGKILVDATRQMLSS